MMLAGSEDKHVGTAFITFHPPAFIKIHPPALLSFYQRIKILAL